VRPARGRVDSLAAGPTRQWVNLFEITNRDELDLEYRLLAISGLMAGEEYDKNLQKLRQQVAAEIQQPVALVRRGEAHYLAVPADAPLPATQQRLTPHVALLHPAGEALPLNLSRLDPTTRPIAAAFLASALRRPLWRRHDLWEAGRSTFRKRPLNADDPGASVDVYEGFVWNVVAHEDGRLFVSVDPVCRYVDRAWLSDRLADGSEEAQRLNLRHCLYQFGHQWYIVQLLGLTGQSVSEQCFVLEQTGDITNVLDYTWERWGPNPPPWVRGVDPSSPAIAYRYPGKDRRIQRYGALALCKLTRRTHDRDIPRLHRRYAVLEPATRILRSVRAVQEYFQEADLGGLTIRITDAPLEIVRRVFAVPAQRFGHNRVLSVSRGALGPSKAPPADPVTDRVAIERLGQRRLDLLLDPQAGPLDRSPFHAQYLLVPHSLPRPINEDFEQRLVAAVRALSGQATYAVRRVLYDDRQAKGLFQQVQAIGKAVLQNAIGHGYGLLVLPPHADTHLHDAIKAEHWPDLQFQCATATKLGSFYVRGRDPGSYVVPPERAKALDSYVRSCALAMLVLNRKWAWALATPLHYEVYVGIDVLNHMTGVTFVYRNGAEIVFNNYRSKQPERLTSRQLRDILVRTLGEHLRDLGLRPHSLVLHRDGRTYASELKALRDAVHELQRQGVLPLDIEVGVVEIRKTTADHLRIVEGTELAMVHNPTIGSSHTLGASEGIVCTTGEPFRLPGTAKPVAAVIVEGTLRIDWVLEDIADLAQLVFTAPDRCARLPATIKLADDFLEPIASATDQEGALYDEDTPEDEEGADELEEPKTARQRDAATRGPRPAPAGDTAGRGGNRS
jgi:hypothetical protein